MKAKRIIIYAAGFLFSMALALTSYINSSFLEGYIDENYIGIIYIVASLITIVGLLELPKLLTKLGNRRTTLLFSFLTLFSFILLSNSGKASIVISAFILYFVSTSFIIATLDIFIEDFSKNSAIGKFRGLYVVIINSAWVVAQVIAGDIISKNSFSGIYYVSAVLMVLVSAIFIFSMRKFKDPHYNKVPIRKTISVFIKSKNLSKIYLINLIFRFFLAWMVIYTPIYLREYIGFGWDQIGIIFTIMLLPYVLFGFPLGEWSDKIGEKKMLLAGFLICAIPTTLLPFLTGTNIWFWALLLFTTRIGSATIEVMSESYFFKSVTEKNDDEISFFRNTYPLSYLIAPLIAIPTLLLVPSFKYLFFILGAIMLVGFFISLRLRDVK